MKKKELLARVLALTVATTMSVGTAIPAYAEMEQNEPSISSEVEADEETVEIEEDLDLTEEESLEEGSFTEANGAAEDDSSEETEKAVKSYADFLSKFKGLVAYANEYAAENPGADVNALVINYVRTGFKKYATDSWQIMAGPENKAFVAYVADKDAANGTEISVLRNLEEFTLPNGDKVDFKHMFGTMDITSYVKSQGSGETTVVARSDMGGWAGDICDLLNLALQKNVSGENVEEVLPEVRALLGFSPERGAGYSHSFEQTDIYGDLDAFYLMNEIAKNTTPIDEVFEAYFTDRLTDEARAEYFLVNRLNSVKNKGGIRSAILDTYRSNTLITTLEASRGLTDVSDTLRVASCYAFADYLYELAGNDDVVDPDPGKGDDDDDDNKEKENL